MHRAGGGGGGRGDHRGSEEAYRVVQYVGKEEVPSYCLSRANEGGGGGGEQDRVS